jgi:hypothetical protein
MDGYVLGRHTGELPLHLLQEGEPGNRIRAIARVEGPDHDVVYAIEAPDEQALSLHTTSTSTAGTSSTKSLIVCVSLPCQAQGGHTNGNPMHMPPWECILFLWLEAEDISEIVGDIKESLGADSIYTATDGEGHFLVQLGSDDQERVDEAAARLTSAVGAGAGASHRVPQSDIFRA